MHRWLLDAISLLTVRGAMRLTQLISFLLIARFLGPEEFGRFSIITTMVLLAQVLGNMGLRQAAAFMVGQGKVDRADVMGSLYIAWPVLSIGSSLIVLWLTTTELQSHQEATSTCIAIAAAIFITMIQGVFLGLGALRWFNLSETSPRVILALVAAVLATFYDLTTETALWAFAASFILTIPIIYYFARNLLPMPRLSLSYIGPMLSYGGIFAVAMTLTTLNPRVGVFLLNWYKGSLAAGEYFAALRVAEIFLEMATVLGLVLFSHSVRSTDTKKTIHQVARVCAWILWTFTVGGVIVAAAAPIVLRALLGSDYTSSSIPLQLVGLGLGASATIRVLNTTLAGQGRPGFVVAPVFIGLLINIVIAMLLIPPHGSAGAATAFVSGQFATLAAYLITCSKLLHIPWQTFLIPNLEDCRKTLELLRANLTVRVSRWRPKR